MEAVSLNRHTMFGQAMGPSSFSSIPAGHYQPVSQRTMMGPDETGYTVSQPDNGGIRTIQITNGNRADIAEILLSFGQEVILDLRKTSETTPTKTRSESPHNSTPCTTPQRYGEVTPNRATPTGATQEPSQRPLSAILPQWNTETPSTNCQQKHFHKLTPTALSLRYEEVTPTKTHSPVKRESMGTRHNVSLKQMIAEALLDAPRGKLLLPDICAHISRRYKAHVDDGKIWRHQVKQTLNKEECFKKDEKSRDCPYYKWSINSHHIDGFRAGNFSPRNSDLLSERKKCKDQTRKKTSKENIEHRVKTFHGYNPARPLVPILPKPAGAMQSQLGMSYCMPGLYDVCSRCCNIGTKNSENLRRKYHFGTAYNSVSGKNDTRSSRRSPFGVNTAAQNVAPFGVNSGQNVARAILENHDYKVSCDVFKNVNGSTGVPSYLFDTGKSGMSHSSLKGDCNDKMTNSTSKVGGGLCNVNAIGLDLRGHENGSKTREELHNNNNASDKMCNNVEKSMGNGASVPQNLDSNISNGSCQPSNTAWQQVSPIQYKGISLPGQVSTDVTSYFTQQAARAPLSQLQPINNSQSNGLTYLNQNSFEASVQPCLNPYSCGSVNKGLSNIYRPYNVSPMATSLYQTSGPLRPTYTSTSQWIPIYMYNEKP